MVALSPVVSWSLDPKNQYPSPYVMLGNNPLNGLDPDGAWFWENSNVRQARTYAEATGGVFDKFKVNRKVYASVTNNSTTSDGVNVHTTIFKPGEDKSLLLMSAGVGYYKSQRASASGFKERTRWALKTGDAWIYGWGEFGRNGQAPAVAKVLAGTNPLFSVPNSIKILTTEEDMYGVEASSVLDKAIAIAGIAAPFNPGANAGRMFLGSAKSGKIVDGINTLIQTSNDGGLLDKYKIQKSEDGNTSEIKDEQEFTEQENNAPLHTDSQSSTNKTTN